MMPAESPSLRAAPPPSWCQHSFRANHIWVETSTDFGVFNDDDPYAGGREEKSRLHLSNLLAQAGKTWKSVILSASTAPHRQAVAPRPRNYTRHHAEECCNAIVDAARSEIPESPGRSKIHHSRAIDTACTAAYSHPSWLRQDVYVDFSERIPQRSKVEWRTSRRNSNGET